MILKLYTVYMHISPINKRYIGITRTEVEKRWRKNGEGYKTQQYFWRAIEKYSWDNFQHIIVAKGLDEETAKWLEIELIRKWNTTNPNKGYNISLGGDVTSEETKIKISENHADVSGENHPMYGKHHTEETRKKISKKAKERFENKENHPSFGKQHSEETRKKISESLIGKPLTETHKQSISNAMQGSNNPSAKKVICLETMEIFNTIKDASEQMNCSSAGLGTAIKKHKKYKGYTFMLYEEYLKTI